MFIPVASSSILLSLKEWFRFPALGSETKPSIPASTSQDQPPGRVSPFSITSSLQTFLTANSSPPYSSERQHAKTTSTTSSNNSFHYTVTSINSYKCRTNVLYPRRADPLPIAVLPDSVVSLDIPIWDVEYLCAALLPGTETRLMPAGTVLLRALGLKGDYSRRASKWTDEEFRYCCQLFIVLAREILLKDAALAKELERPCNLLHETFKDVLFKPFSVLLTSSFAVTSPEVQRFVCVLHALCSAMDTFQEALNVAKAPAASDDAPRGHQRNALWRLTVSTSSSLAMDRYRKELGQKLIQAQEQSNSLARQPEDSPIQRS